MIHDRVVLLNSCKMINAKNDSVYPTDNLVKILILTFLSVKIKPSLGVFCRKLNSTTLD